MDVATRLRFASHVPGAYSVASAFGVPEALTPGVIPENKTLRSPCRGVPAAEKIPRTIVQADDQPEP